MSDSPSSKEVIGRAQTDVRDLCLARSRVELEAIGEKIELDLIVFGTYKLYFMNSSTSIMAASLPHL